MNLIKQLGGNIWEIDYKNVEFVIYDPISDTIISQPVFSSELAIEIIFTGVIPDRKDVVVLGVL